ncbi:hypothetical protein [Chromobacterium haemolyticum]|uniref:hypothetical protein n=1 Tax=Chromobacterium TaxID=535 RepID=UPI0040564025
MAESRQKGKATIKATGTGAKESKAPSEKYGHTKLRFDPSLDTAKLVAGVSREMRDALRGTHWRFTPNPSGEEAKTPPRNEPSLEQSLASTSYEQHNQDMSTAPTREELDAKLELIETRLDSKVQRIEDKMDGFLAASKETQDSIKSLKTTIIVTALSTVLAIVLGVAAFNSTVLSNMVASFESGKNTAQAIDKAQTELQKREARLDEIDKKLDKLIAAPPPQK